MNKFIGVIVIIILIVLLLFILSIAAKEFLGYYPHEVAIEEVTKIKDEVTHKDSTNTAQTKTDQKAILSKYKFKDYPENFTFHYYLGNDNEPMIEDTLEQNSEGKYVLSLKFTNIEKDSIYNGGKYYTNLYQNNVKDINSFTIKREGEVSTYNFLLNDKLEYKISIDKDTYPEKRVVLQIFHK